MHELYIERVVSSFENLVIDHGPAFTCHSPLGTIRSRLMARYSAGRRAICKAQNPDCKKCPLNKLCPASRI